MYVVCVSVYLWKPEGGVRSPRVVVTGNCVSPDVGAGNTS